MANLTDIGYGIGKYLEASDATSLPDIGTNRKNLDLLNFKVAVNNAYALYNFKDGMIDGYQTQDGVDAANSTRAVYDSTDKVYKVVSPPTGGTISTYSTYTVHTFLTGADFVNASTGTADILVVAGGGGGGYQGGGGGGAGGLLTFASQSVAAGTHTVTVGSGGAGGPSGPVKGGDGGDSQFGSLTSVNGGGGGGSNVSRPGSPGGSGGGQSKDGNSGGAPATPAGQGNNGGASSCGSSCGSGGGGGAGAVGESSPSSGPYWENSGFGGVGLQNNYRTGSNIYYAGGGGGGMNTSVGGNWTRQAEGGDGGGGDGGMSGPVGGPATVPTAGTDGLGGGGGAGAWNVGQPGGTGVPGADGGDGIVVVRFTTGALGGYNITLQSNAQTAQASPDEGRLMLYEEDVDSITPGTDIKGYVSRDGGTTWSSAVGLVDDGADHIIPAVDNTGGIDANTLMMLHMDGSNDGTTFTDNGTVAQTFTPTGAVTKTAEKKFGTASGYFGGNSCAGAPAGQYLTGNTATISGNNSYTVDFWMYATNAACAQWQHMVGISNTSSNNSILGIAINASNELCANHYSNDFNSGFVVTGNAWHHIANVYDGTTEYLFCDGDLKDTRTGMATFTLDGTPVIIGAENWNATGSYPYEGYLDEVRISNVARWTASFIAPIAPYTSGSYTEPVLAKTVRVLSGSVDISGQPAGTDMKYKVETLNNKNLKLHGASLLWA